MDVQVKWDQAFFDRVKVEAPQAAARAVNKTTAQMRTQASQMVTAEFNIAVAEVKRNLTMGKRDQLS